jgi:precorrin-4/cobalt-precorrin-4 C11-methyltransferase
MTVYFIGAGPGDPDLITLKGMRLIQNCPVILYAGSLVPVEILDFAADDAAIEDTASKHLDEIITRIEIAHGNNQDVARVHSGDPSIYGAIGEQMRRLDDLNIDYEIIPGVTAASASAAMLKREFTLSGVTQTVIYTRYGSKTPMPEKENLDATGDSFRGEPHSQNCQRTRTTLWCRLPRSCLLSHRLARSRSRHWYTG